MTKSSAVPASLLRQALTLTQLNAAFLRVAQNAGGPGSDGQTIDQFGIRLPERLRALRDEVVAQRYQPLPLLRVWLPRPNKPPRPLAIPAVRDRVLQTAVAQVLRPLFEAEFEECSFAYRQGRSVRQAVERIAYLQRQGYRWVFDADIEAFFYRIPHAPLLAQLARVAPDQNLRPLIDLWLGCDVLDQGRIQASTIGIAQGSPLSPMLANLYLDHLDEALLGENLAVIRYADDFVVLTKCRERAEDALELTEEILRKLHLKLNPLKTRIVSLDEGFQFLGWNFVRTLAVPVHRKNESAGAHPSVATTGVKPALQDAATASGEVPDAEGAMQGILGVALDAALAESPAWAEGILKVDEADLESPAADIHLIAYASVADAISDGSEAQPAPPHAAQVVAMPDEEMDDLAPSLPAIGCIQRTLYLVDEGAELAKESEKLVVRKNGVELLSLPALNVDQVMIFGRNGISTPAMQLCLRHRIPIALLSRLGRYHGRIDAENFSFLQLQYAQFSAHHDKPRGLILAQAMQRGKLENSALVLTRYARHREGQGADACHLAQRLRMAADLDTLRGYEGAAAKAYFGAWKLILAPEWGFTQRIARPAPDPINVLLSFGYTILYQCVAGLLQARGLNPHLAFFHAGSGTHLALASDLMEEFRAVVVDACILNLCMNARLTPQHFRQSGASCILSSDGARLFIRALEGKFNSTMTHPVTGQSLDLRRIIDAQVQSLCKAIRHPGQASYQACVFR